jgi:hypothetical protein
MLNLFPKKKSVDELVDSVGPYDVYRPVQTPSYVQAQQDMIDDLFKKNYELKKENEKLKKENVELMERVNEIDSDVNRDLQDQLFTLKNDYAVLKAKYTELLEKYNSFVTMGGQKYMEAKLQIVQNNYKKCASERDEYKHQLNAANKENEKLKKDIVDYVFEKDNQVNFFEEELKRLKSITKEEYDKIPVVGSADIIGNLLQKAKDLVEGVEVDLDKSLDEQCDKEDEPAFLKCACGDCHEKTKQYNQFHDDMYYQDAYAEKKEKSWEEVASDLALKVTKLEEQLKIHKLLIDQLNKYISCQK